MMKLFFEIFLKCVNKCDLIMRFVYVNFFTPRICVKKNKMAYLSYLPEPYIRKDNITYLNKHQNRREALSLIDIFENFSYGVVIERFDRYFFSKEKYDLVWGLEPNFTRLSKLNPKAKKIYYATGSYYSHQNSMIIQRTDQFNKSHSANLSYHRLVAPHNSCEVADVIFQIGCKKTINTYPEKLRKKIKIINQSCHSFKNFVISDKNDKYKKNEFIWLGSGGSILKGLDLLFDYFILNPQFNLNVVGPLDKDFYLYYKDKIQACKNITYYGFMDMDDPELIHIANRCVAIIFPSCSEGLPGSVINMMKLGLIPIVTQWCSVDGIEDLGYELSGLSIEEIENSVSWIMNLSESQITDLFLKNYNYANLNFNLDKFKETFSLALSLSIC